MGAPAGSLCRLSTRSAPVAILAVALALLVGCGEDREGSVEQRGGTDTATTGTGTSTSDATTAPAGPVVATVKVTETEFALDPQDPKLKQAGVVKFEVTNAGKVTHALEVEGPKGEVETEAIEPGRKASLEADLSKPGTYTWYCPIGDHEARGMKGKITVAGGGSATAPDASGRGRDDSRERPDDPGRGRDDSGRGPDGSGRDDSGPGGY